MADPLASCPPDDDALMNYAQRIRARAIRRCGELLKEMEAKPGARTDLEPRAGTDPRLSPRQQAAQEAGLSERQTKTALRVASVPAELVREIEEELLDVAG